MLKVFTTTGATILLLLGLVVAAAADDRMRAEVCKRMLGAMAEGQPEQVADLMVESGPPGLTVTNNVGLDRLRVQWRAAYERAMQNNGGSGVKAREAQPEQRFGARVAVIERWDLGNGRQPYAGCLQSFDGSRWVTNLQISPDLEFVTTKLRDAAAGKPTPAAQ